MLLAFFLQGIFISVSASRPHVHVSASRYNKRLAEPPGYNVQIWECDPQFADRQQWNFPPNSLNQITLKSNGWCLDVEDYGTTDESNVWVSACHPDDTDPAHQNQNWSSTTQNEIISLLSGKCLDVSNYGTTDGANVWIYSCTGADNQHWKYNATDGTIRGVQSGLCLDAGSSFPAPCSADPEKSYPMCDTSLPYDQRVEDLLSRMTVSEKIGLFGNTAGAVSSLQLPPYQWWSEALHGVAYSPGVTFGGDLPYATSFPQVIGTAASFNRTLFHTIGETISTEARAFANQGQAGLTFWAPNINIFRDPRWGRGQETPGEDPYLNSEYAANFVSGMQSGPDPKYMKVSSCCKHYAAYSLEDSDGVDRHHFDGNVTAQDWNDTYLVAFQSCVERAKGSIMCSYNANNGVPSCADSNLLTTDLRKSWGFNGYVTGDCGAVDDVLYAHEYTSTTQDTCAAVLHAGLDVDCGGFLQGNLQNALNLGTVTENDLDTRLTDLFLVQMNLGYFDPPEQQQYRQITPDAVNTPANQQLALDAARQGIVLLKNQNNILPLKKGSVNTIAAVGPNANAAGTMQGNYNGAAPYLITPVKGLQAYATVTYAQGCSIAGSDTGGISAAVSAAQSADATVIVVGLDQTQESEGLDRVSIAFPGVQAQLISQVASAAKGPVIVVVESGSSVDLADQVANSNVDAILWIGYPGQSGGQALAEIIFGDVNPAGRLPYTLHHASFANEVVMTDMGMRPSSTNPGRTYRFYPNSVVYPFGTGLSYTTFSYVVTFATSEVSARVIEKSLSNARGLQKEMLLPINTAASISVNVTNTGSVAGADAVLNFVIPPNAGQDGTPLKYLTGFERVYLLPGQSQVVTFDVPAQSLALAGLDGVYRAHYGKWRFEIGVGENAVSKELNVLPESAIIF